MSEQVQAVDLTNCDREPIHILGAIQPFGFLLQVTSDWLVARVSSNVADHLSHAPADMLGKSLDGFFLPAAVHQLRNMVSLLRGSDTVERAFSVALIEGSIRFDIALHLTEQGLVIEAEPVSGGLGDTNSVVRRMVSRVRTTTSLQQFLQEAARQVRGVTGFDRVMVYRFDQSGSGEVVAEARGSGIDSFLGLHYPASDIPAQARTLYLRNTFRIIADVSAQAASIVPPRDNQGRPLDLSLSVLRAVSPIHIEYLKNMGVGASLSISIVVEGRLWGLFACHHYAPKLPGFADRTMAELFGSMFSFMLEARERALSADYEMKSRLISDRLMAVLAQDASRLADAEWLSSVVADAIPCDGVGVVVSGEISLSGLTPSESEFMTIVHMLNRNAASTVFTTGPYCFAGGGSRKPCGAGSRAACHSDLAVTARLSGAVSGRAIALGAVGRTSGEIREPGAVRGAPHAAQEL